MAGNSEEEH